MSRLGGRQLDDLDYCAVVRAGVFCLTGQNNPSLARQPRR